MGLSIADYARALRPDLSRDAFAPAPGRLLWLLLHAAVIALGMVVIASGWGGLAAAIPLALLVGHSFAGAAFVGHEALHGSIVRQRAARHAVGWLAFLPFAVSPTLWNAWHNRVHHGHTAEEGVDPDSYPTLTAYRGSRALRIADRIAPAARRIGGLCTLLIGFTVQAGAQLVGGKRSLGLSRSEQRRVWIETGAALAVWITVGVLLGPTRFLLAFGLPLLVGNAIVISYILTNHSLSPLTETNDPLLNSLSVTVPRPFALLHLNFGYHVEHHLFPSMSPRRAPELRALLQRRWPERYQSMPLARALVTLFRTPRVYRDATTLIDPRSGLLATTLLPGAKAVVITSDRRPSLATAATAVPTVR